jgi:subtilisin-like proprotein convertase family protein
MNSSYKIWSTLFVVSALFYSYDSHAYSPAIAGCTQSFIEASNTTSTALTDNGTKTSTVSISNQSGTIIDVDLVTFIAHTNSNDLDIALTSPAGTTVTITTDNGVNYDNVFNGTYWDDQAFPYNPIPLNGNPTIGSVAKRSFDDLVVVSPVLPEENLDAFSGESPNGTWTLTVIDDSATESGTLTSWKIRVTTCTTTPAKSSTTFTNSTVTSIPDAGSAVTSINTASNLATSLCGVELTTNVTHTFPGDIEMTLTSPAGTIATITDNLGSSADNIFAGTTWKSLADPTSTIPYSGNPNILTEHTFTSGTAVAELTPLESLAVFNGENPNGDWTLTLRDTAASDTGNLNSWSVKLTTCQPDSDSDGTPDSTDSCDGTDTDTNNNSIADCLESDLKPVSLQATRKNGKLTCSFKIQNSGSSASAASAAQVRFASGSDSIGTAVKSFTVPALAAGAKSSTFSFSKAPNGKRYCRIVADSTNQLIESNENNNSKWQRAK